MVTIKTIDLTPEKYKGLLEVQKHNGKVRFRRKYMGKDGKPFWSVWIVGIYPFEMADQNLTS